MFYYPLVRPFKRPAYVKIPECIDVREVADLRRPERIPFATLLTVDEGRPSLDIVLLLMPTIGANDIRLKI